MTYNRRQRNRVDVPAGLIADDGFWAVNLSESGLMLCSRTAFEPGATIEITLALPSCKLKASARVVWCKKATSTSHLEYFVGAAFVALSRSTQREITAYIAECSELLESTIGIYKEL